MTMSRKQRAANRINGQKGGPRTEEGRNISKMNAVSHALTANLIVLCTEDKARFQAMLDAYVQLLKPVGIEENDLLEEIVVGKWRQKRLWGVESSIYEMAMLEAGEAMEKKFSQADEGTRIAFAMTRQHGQVKALALVSCYEGRARRLHQTARKDLDRLQSARKPKPEPVRKVEEKPKITMHSATCDPQLPERIDQTNEPVYTPNPPEIDLKNEPKEPKEE
jgi:hypothetical protein